MTDLSTLVEKVAAMDFEERERWMKHNGYTGMAAVALMRQVRGHLEWLAARPEAK